MKKEEKKFAKQLKGTEISQEMESSYLDYAMSVIIARALPDVRDGLKPVHRRILYTMKEMGLSSASKFRKSATVVGAVLGRYHPHGDVALYDALVRMAQEFSLRHPLIKGQGNFGSIDGDSAAAMRYTECKLSPLAEEMLLDIEKETVDFMPNYDATRKEPKVLPAKLPNLIVNGTLGIAVGMATSIPPHNLGEICDAVIYLIKHPKAEVLDLLEFVQGPDFSTGALVYDWEELKSMYSSGKGRVIMRAKAQILEGKAGRFKIEITEIPYQVNKALLLQKIASLVKDKKIKGIADLRDASGKDGIKIVIDLKREAHPKKVLNQLYKFTPLQEILYVNMLALDQGIQPRVFNLKTLLWAYILHRKEIITKRTSFDLKQAEARKHILEGLLIALDHLDQVIKTIRSSSDRIEAGKQLIKKFKLSNLQAEAILEMRLHQLSALERKEILNEYKQIKIKIKELKTILGSEKAILNIVSQETLALKKKYAEERKTKIIKQKIGEMTVEDLIANEPNLVVITKDNYIKRMPINAYRSQVRGGKGVLGMATKTEDEVAEIFAAMTHDRLLFFTNEGRVLENYVYDLPEGLRQSKGTAIVNFIELKSQEKVTAVVNLTSGSGYGYLFMATRKGVVKKVKIADLEKIRKTGIIIIKLQKEDSLLWAEPTSGRDEIILISGLGQSIRFREAEVRPVGRAAGGVKGIELETDDYLVGMNTIAKAQKTDENLSKAFKEKNLSQVDSSALAILKARSSTGDCLLAVSQFGYGKISRLRNFKVQRRGGKGIKASKVTRKTGNLVVARLVDPSQKSDLILISKKGQMIRTPLFSLRPLSRVTQGVRLMKLRVDDELASVAVS